MSSSNTARGCRATSSSPSSWTRSSSTSSTKNLRIAAEDELDEAERIYPEFAATAREEGFPEIVALYDNIIQVETCHQKLFSELYRQMKNGTMYKKKEKVKWKCADCGYEATAKEAWQECPLCKAKQGSVMIQIED